MLDLWWAKWWQHYHHHYYYYYCYYYYFCITVQFPIIEFQTFLPQIFWSKENFSLLLFLAFSWRLRLQCLSTSPLNSLLVDYTLFLFQSFSLLFLIHPICRCAQHITVFWVECFLLQICSSININFNIVADNSLCIFLYWPIPSSKYCPFKGSKTRFQVLRHHPVSSCIAQDTSHYCCTYFYFIIPMKTILNSWNLAVRNRKFWQPQFSFAVVSIHYCGQRNKKEVFLQELQVHPAKIIPPVIPTLCCVIWSVVIVVTQHT